MSSVARAWWQVPLPREHGAWVMLATAAYAGLSQRDWHDGRARWPHLLCITGTLLVFLAREPAAVALGRRTQRRKLAQGSVARWQAAILAMLGITACAVAVFNGPTDVEVPLLALAVLGALSAWMVARGSEHTLLGELVAAVALATTAPLIGLAGIGANLLKLWPIWLGWSWTFCATTLSVHLQKRFLLGKTSRGLVLAGQYGLALTPYVTMVVLYELAPQLHRLLGEFRVYKWYPALSLPPLLVGMAQRPRHLQWAGIAVAVVYVVTLAL